MFARGPGEPDDQSVRLKVELGETAVFDSPVNFSFRGKQRSRVLMAMNGLAIPAAGKLSFSFLSAEGVSLGPTWEVIIEKAPAQAGQPQPA